MGGALVGLKVRSFSFANMDQLMEGWLQSLNGKVAPESQKSYLFELRQHLEILGGAGMSPETASRENLQWAIDTRLEPLRYNGISVSAIRAFYDFLFVEGLRPDDPGMDVRYGRRTPTPATVYTIEQMSAYLEFAKLRAKTSRDTFVCTREWASLELLYACGMLPTELAGLPRQDLSGPYLTIIGNNRTTRTVPITATAKNAVTEWVALANSQAKNTSKTNLFFTRRGSPIARWGLALSAHKVALAFGEAWAMDITPAGIRATMIRHLIDRGCPQPIVAKIVSIGLDSELLRA